MFLLLLLAFTWYVHIDVIHLCPKKYARDHSEHALLCCGCFFVEELRDNYAVAMRIKKVAKTFIGVDFCLGKIQKIKKVSDRKLYRKTALECDEKMAELGIQLPRFLQGALTLMRRADEVVKVDLGDSETT